MMLSARLVRCSCDEMNASPSGWLKDDRIMTAIATAIATGLNDGGRGSIWAGQAIQDLPPPLRP